MEKQKRTEKQEPAAPHDLIMEDRSRLTVTGVRRVLHCSADSAAVETNKGTLNIAGVELSVTALDLDAGEVKLAGRFDALEYTEEHTAGGLLRRLLH